MESLSALAMVALGVLLLSAAGTSTPRKTQQVAYSSGRHEQLPRRVVLIPDEDEEYPYGSGPSFRSAAPARLAKPSPAKGPEKANKEKGWLENILQQASDSGLNIPNYTPTTSSSAQAQTQSNNQVHHVIHLADGTSFDVNTGEMKPSKLASPPVNPQQDSVPIIIVGVPVPADTGYPPGNKPYPPSYPPSRPPPSYPPPPLYMQASPQSTYASNYQNYAPTPPQNSYAPNYQTYPPNPAVPPYTPGYSARVPPYGYFPPPWYQPPQMPYRPYSWPPYRPPYMPPYGPPNKGPDGWYGSYYGYRPYGGPGGYQSTVDPNSPLEGYGKPGTYNNRPAHYGKPGQYYGPPYNPYWVHHGHGDQNEDDDDDDDEEDRRPAQGYSHYPNDYHYPYDYKTKQKGVGSNRDGSIRPQRKPDMEEQHREPEVNRYGVEEEY